MLTNEFQLLDQLGVRLRGYLDGLTITSNNIGDIRRSLFLPFDCEWNRIVRDETAKRENYLKRGKEGPVIPKI